MSITAVLIDDERPALRILEILLQNIPEVSVIGSYTNPIQAIEDIKKLTPTIVFLDIHMPQMQGLEAGSQIMDVSPDTDIIFVTAYDQYALEAFDLHAIDYIRKPINPERLRKSIDRVLKKQFIVPQRIPQKLQLKCLGNFYLAWEDKEPIKWRSEKTKEMFVFLLHNRGRIITKEEILDQLWPDEDLEKAMRLLYNGSYYIRKALEEYGVKPHQVNVESYYCLKIGEVELDVERFKAFEKGMTTNTVSQLEEMEALYSGGYLEYEDYQWAYKERQALSALYQECLMRLSKLYMDNEQNVLAEKRLLKAYEINPYEEKIVEQLLKFYIKIGDKSRGVRCFQSFATLMKEELRVKPSEKLIELYRLLLSSL